MPETISDTRQHLTSHVARFREQGIEAEPVVFGDHRQPEAALLPYETFRLLLDVAEDIAIAERLRQRLADDDGQRIELAALAAELEVDIESM